MAEDSLLNRIDNARHRDLLSNTIDITDDIKVAMGEIINKIDYFFHSIGENVDVSGIRVYVDDDSGDSLLSREGANAAMFDNNILLSKQLLSGDRGKMKFMFAHELIHSLVRNKGVEVNKKIHKRTGYNLMHFEYDSDKDVATMEKDFFVDFNEGMTEWLGVLIFGKEYEKSMVRDGRNHKLYRLVKFLVKGVGDSLDENEIAKDYIRGGTKFLHAIKAKHGSGAIRILNSRINHNFMSTIWDFFNPYDLEEKNHARNVLLG